MDKANQAEGTFARGLVHALAAVSFLAFAAPACADTVEVVTVTAERRTENLQSVPLSVTAISGDLLQKMGATDFADYAKAVPNLSYGTGNGFGVSTAREVTLRGVAGTNTTNFYIDDTPVPLSLDPRVLDLQRIEVLRGPQGTLFGASSMGGTIRLITKPADPDNGGGFVDAKAFGVNHGGAGYDVSGTYNIPLIDDELGLKVSAYNSFTPGIYTRDYGIATTPGFTVPPGSPVGQDKNIGNSGEYGGMATLTWTPKVVPGLTVTPMVIYQDMHGNGLPLSDFTPDNLVQVRPLNVAEGVADKWTFAGLTARYDAGFGQFISSSTYFHRQAFDNEDGTEAVATLFGGYANPPLDPVYLASPSPSFVNTRSFTQEVRFESAFDGPIQVIAGGYFNDNATNTIQRELTPYDGTGAPAFVENVPRDYHERAAFVNLTYTPTESIELSAGVRQAHLSYYTAYVADGWINGGPSDSPVSHKEDATTPRFTAKYQIDQDDMVYANVAKGYRVGGATSQLPPLCAGDLANAGLPDGPIPYNSDSLWSYELGTKNSWFADHVQTRAALYYIDWSNIQQAILLPCTYHVTLNAGAAVSQGAELEADVSLADNFTVSLSGGYDDAHISKTTSGSNFVVGQQLNGVPKWTAAFTTEYTVPTEFGQAFLRGQYNFVGTSISYANDPAGRLRQAYSLVDLHLGADYGPWEASIYAKNLFDERADLGDEQSEVSELPGRPRYLIAQPRTIGLELLRKF